MSEVKTRLTFAKVIVQEAGISALKEFAHWKDLAITEKGAQDFVSEVDKATERFLRSKYKIILHTTESSVKNMDGQMI